MLTCGSCTFEIYPEDEDYFQFDDKLYCETCWDENVCHLCGYLSKDGDYLYCEDCLSHVTGQGQCHCAVILTPQYHGVTCRQCFKEGTYLCEVCGMDLYHFVKTTTVTFCEENTYLDNCEYNGLICHTCLKSQTKV